jgi:hypothetical protein
LSNTVLLKVLSEQHALLGDDKTDKRKVERKAEGEGKEKEGEEGKDEEERRDNFTVPWHYVMGTFSFPANSSEFLNFQNRK